MFAVVIFLFILQNFEALSQTANVTITDGSIQGLTLYTKNNVRFESYKGIPYAKPPLKALRFAAPEPNEPWNGTLNATVLPNQCIQYASGDTSTVYGNEDCLFINVDVPVVNVTNSSGLPVLVWIHGGTFLTGNASSFEGHYFLEQGVIFVALNYRLGIFGFLSTEDEACPGNWGIKDQILALKWVQKNIKYFGGNPNNVTIFGESAGSVAVSLLMQTNLTTGLFHRAIMNSGTTLNLWSLNTRAKEIARLVGVNLGIVSLTNANLVKRLRNVDAKWMQQIGYTTGMSVYLTNALRGLPFAPTMEPSNVSGAVYTKESDCALRDGFFQRVPVLIGFNSQEAAAATTLPVLLRTYFLYYDVLTGYLSPYGLTGNNLITASTAGTFIKYYYFKYSPITLNNGALVTYISQDQFVRAIIRAAMNMAKYVDVYLYQLGYESGRQDYEGVGHAEDLAYLFSNQDGFLNSTADYTVSRNMAKLWGNFVKYSNPTPYEGQDFDNISWKKINATSQDLDYFSINQTLSTQINPKNDEWVFYDGIFETFENSKSCYTTY